MATRRVKCFVASPFMATGGSRPGSIPTVRFSNIAVGSRPSVAFPTRLRYPRPNTQPPSKAVEDENMDDRRFDSIARSLASGASRRQVLKGALGLGAGAATLVLTNDADAARRGYPGLPWVSPPCRPSCDGSTCGDDGCGGLCACGIGCTCLADDLPDPPPDTPRICAENTIWTPGEPCTDPQFACDPNSAWPTCEPVTGACILAC
jgi:hypothetical protein